MNPKYLWHRLWHWHSSFTKDHLDATVYACIRRIWWRPWHVDVDRIHVGLKKNNTPWVAEATLNYDNFERLIAADNVNDMFAIIAEEGK